MLLAWLQLIRWKNLILITLSQVLILNCLFSFSIHNISAIVFVLNTLLITAAGNIINDYFDVVPDSINKPEKCIVGNTLTKKQVLTVYVAFNLIALVCNVISFVYHPNVIVFLVVNITVFLLYTYSKSLKGKPFVGNLLVAGLTSISVFVLQEFGQVSGDSLRVVYIISLYAFVINLIREFVKDIEDIKGDKKARLQTLPILIGVDRVRKIVSILTVLVLVSFSVLCFWMSLSLKLFTCFFLMIPLMYVYQLLRNRKENINYSKISNLLKLIIGFGILSVILV